MSLRHEIRTLVLQALYQVDARGEADWEAVAASVGEAPHRAEIRERAMAIARAVWTARSEADEAAGQLAPDWPITRRPVIDRNLIRLAYWEMTSGTTPATVAINEAVELAKQFSTDRSPAFVNALLDKMRLALGDQLATPRDDLKAPSQSTDSAADDTGSASTTGDGWLDDALSDPPETH